MVILHPITFQKILQTKLSTGVSKIYRPIYFKKSRFFTQNSHKSKKKGKKGQRYFNNYYICKLQIPTILGVCSVSLSLFAIPIYRSWHMWGLTSFLISLTKKMFGIGVAFCRPFSCCYGIPRLVYFSCCYLKYLTDFIVILLPPGGGGMA